jgi:putative hydrolase of the HAD superfamily
VENDVIRLIAFDADDTLWHSECYYQDAHEVFVKLVEPYEPDKEKTLAVLNDIEMANLPVLGYGVKGFALSMIEAALKLSAGMVTGREIDRIMQIAREMLSRELGLIDGVEETVTALAEQYPLIIITKGDLIDQERKFTSSGLGAYFQSIEVVSSKNPDIYRRILTKYEVTAENFLMVGNSLKSDILPVVELGGWGVHVPYSVTWSHEVIEHVTGKGTRWFELENIRQLESMLANGVFKASRASEG